jgi:hypothetical protein
MYVTVAPAWEAFVFGVPTDGLVWLLAGVGLGVFLSMAGFALVAAQDRRVHRTRIRAGRKAVDAAIAEENARTIEQERFAERQRAATRAPKFAAVTPSPATVADVGPPPPAAEPEPRKGAIPALRLGAALKAAGTAFVRETKAPPAVAVAAEAGAVVAVAPEAVAPPPKPAPPLAREPSRPDPAPAAPSLPKPKQPVADTMPAPPLISASEPKYEAVKDEVIKRSSAKADTFPVPPRKAHINVLPPIVDNDIVVEPPAAPKPKKPLSEKEAAIAAAAARRRAVAAEQEAVRQKAEREAAEKAEAEKLEVERQAAEREAAARRAEAARRLAEREEAERIEAERLAAEQIEKDRIERAARDERERVERAARDEQERAEREEREKEEAARRVTARAAQLREEAERLEAQRRVAERLAALREQEERQAAEAAAVQPRSVRASTPAAAKPQSVDIEAMFAQAFGASVPDATPRDDDEQG